MAEKRKYATYELENQLREKGYKFIVGVDEVGRGPGAGPVTAGAVWIPEDSLPKLLVKVRDSKALTEKRRYELYDLIDETCVWATASISNMIIDNVNILNATKMAMESAINRLAYDYELYADYMLIDGTVKLEGMYTPQAQVIKGDQKSISIAAASIMAKVTRDDEMKTLHWVHPQYDWINNKGYLTKKHIEAIQTYGITDYHRKSFRKVGDNG